MDRLYMIVNRKTGNAKIYTNPPRKKSRASKPLASRKANR